jgi:hypothetical protein
MLGQPDAVPQVLVSVDDLVNRVPDYPGFLAAVLGRNVHLIEEPELHGRSFALPGRVRRA